jgi:hypothetical protein
MPDVPSRPRLHDSHTSGRGPDPSKADDGLALFLGEVETALRDGGRPFPSIPVVLGLAIPAFMLLTSCAPPPHQTSEAGTIRGPTCRAFGA